MAKVLSIVAPEQFQQIEYLESRRALEEAGHEVIMASSVKKPTDKLGRTYNTDLLLTEISESDYDAILFVGGPGVYAFFDDPICLGLAKDFFNDDKPTAAICAAPTILARAGLIKGRKVTCFPSEVPELRKGGGVYTQSHVEHDGLLITADGPGSSYAFGQEVAKALKTN